MARGIGKVFSSAGDNVIGMLAKWWSKAPVEKVLEVKSLREIPNAVHKAKLFESKMAREITENMGEAYKGILDNIRSLDSELRAVSTKVDMSRRQLNVLFDKLGDPTRRYPGLETTIEKHKQYLDLLVKKENSLSERLKILKNFDTEIKTNPQSVASQLDTMPEIMSEFPSLGRWKSVAEEQIARKNQIMGATSRYIDSDKKFIKEYVNEVSKLSDDNPYKVRWLANPQNQIKLTKLQTQPKYAKKLLGITDEAAQRPDIKGISAEQVVKTLGVGAGVAGAVAGAVAIYSWADSSVQVIDNTATSIESSLISVESSGLGAVILSDVIKSVNKINVASDSLKVGLQTSPKESLQAYIKILSDEKANIDKNLKQWNAVVIGSRNREDTKKAGILLQAFSKNLEEELKEVYKILETSGSVSPTPELGMAGEKDVKDVGGISGLQEYLKKVNPSISATGRLDRITIDTLRDLEERYNRAANTNRFTGLFYNPGSGKVIDVEDLRGLERI